jgi:tetratricopeptide (TPR) repeat protein
MLHTRTVVRGSWVVAALSAVAVGIAVLIVTLGRPDTKRIDAQLALADAYYANHDLANAETTYREVIKYPRSNAYWYAMYKLGLIDVERERFREAADKLSEVVQGTHDEAELADLHRASMTDYVRAYAEIGDAENAHATFQRLDDEHALDMLVTLADIYTSKSASAKALYVYQQLIKAAPTVSHVCLWQYNVARAELSLSGRGNPAAVTQIENLVRLWTALHRRNVLPAVEAKQCHDNAAAMAGELARAYHHEAATTKNADTLGYAERLYKAYVDAFRDAADFPQTEYYYAELLWTRADAEADPARRAERWQNAAGVFTDVVTTGKVEAKLMRESAYAAVLAWKNVVNNEPSSDTHADKAVIPDTTRKLIAAIDSFIAVIDNPNDDDVVSTKFIKASSYNRYGHFDEAIPLLEEILGHSGHAIAESAANLLIDILAGLERYDAMFAVIDSMVANAKFLDGKPEKQDRWLAGLRDRGIPLNAEAAAAAVAAKRLRASH